MCVVDGDANIFCALSLRFIADIGLSKSRSMPPAVGSMLDAANGSFDLRIDRGAPRIPPNVGLLFSNLVRGLISLA